MNWPHLLFGLRGRINRAKWWIASGIVLVVLVVLLAALSRSVAVGLDVILVLALLLSVYCLLAVSVKRLHDRNWRGWWILLFPLAPVVLAFVVSAFSEDLGPALTYALWGLVVIITGCGLIALGGLAGAAGLNRYGLDPLAKLRG
jgi:uncharacterized membrane protein YhaH (DUF805 family)